MKARVSQIYLLQYNINEFFFGKNKKNVYSMLVLALVLLVNIEQTLNE